MLGIQGGMPVALINQNKRTKNTQDKDHIELSEGHLMEVSSSIDTLDKTQQAVSTQEKATAENADSTEATNDTADSFAEFMRGALGGSGVTQVNEEELFAGLIQQRLEVENPEAAAYYAEQKAQFMTTLRQSNGYVSVEEAAVEALKATVEAGKIDLESAERINGEAFAAAQLDDNLDALYDSDGSAEDSTVAVASMEAALLSMRTMVDAYDSGEAPAASRALDAAITTTVASSGAAGAGHSGDGSSIEGAQELDGPQGFLWKPVSEGDGNLVVLLPTDLRGMLDRVEIHSELPASADTLLEEGRFSGDEHNGARPHYRFDQPGSGYGSDVHVVAYKTDGTQITWDITNGADRHD